MGISIQQYRSAIGCWNSKKTRKLLPTEETVEIDTDYLDSHGTNVVVCGPWKTHAVLLCLILITTVLMHPVCTGAPDHGHAVTSTMMRVGHNSALTKTDTSTSHIAPQCLHALLIIGGVEVNPGPDRELNIEEQDTIVAGLCAEAPNNDVRDTLRLYDPRLDTRALVKQLSRASKNSLVESLSYLGHDGMSDYMKEACITALICRVQNLFPDQCSFCREQYCIRLMDKPLLSCQNCGHGAHDPCVLDHLQRQPGEHQSLTASLVWNRINPTNLPGLHYLCEACQKTTIPSEEAGKLKRKPSIKLQSATQVDEQNILQESSSHTSDIQPSPDQDDNEPISLDVSGIQDGNRDQAQLPDTQPNICSFYRKGTM